MVRKKSGSAKIKSKRVVVYILILVVLIAGIFGLHRATSQTTSVKANNQTVQQRLTSGESTTCSRYNIPARSCARAIKAGAYCPSWDAKPGSAAPQFCEKIKIAH